MGCKAVVNLKHFLSYGFCCTYCLQFELRLGRSFTVGLFRLKNMIYLFTLGF